MLESIARRACSISMLVACVVASCADDHTQPEPEPVGIRFEEIPLENAPSDVSAMAFAPDRREILLTTRGGDLVHLHLGEDGARVVSTFRIPSVYADLDCGLISLAFDPAFAENGYLYVGQCMSLHESAIRRITLDVASLDPVAGSDVDILRAGDQAALRPWHNVGQIGFDDEGALWALFGDKTVRENGQDRDDLLGSLVRMIPRRGPGSSGADPAPSNPHFGSSTLNPFVYAYGFRSPWRGVVDAHGRYFVGDVGENTWEEINLVSEPDMNFGWGTVEGPCTKNCEGLTDPIQHWSRGDSEPEILADPEAEGSAYRVSWVGLAYDDTKDQYGDLLDDTVLYGDLCVGFVRGLRVDTNGRVVDDRHLGHLSGATGMAQGPDGYVYATTFGGCVSVGPSAPTRLYRALVEYD